jgi:hypothetical protein
VFIVGNVVWGRVVGLNGSLSHASADDGAYKFSRNEWALYEKPRTKENDLPLLHTREGKIHFRWARQAKRKNLDQSAKDFRTPALIALTAPVAPIIGRSIATCAQHPAPRTDWRAVN